MITAERKPRRWQNGDRVTRPVFLDDGTWQREGDACIARSPLKRGVVVSARWDRIWIYAVQWDGEANAEDGYFTHGLDAENV